MGPSMQSTPGKYTSLVLVHPAVEDARVPPSSRYLVVPAKPTNDHWLSLSNLDRVVSPTFSRVILFYKNVLNAEVEFEDVTRSLRESLSKVLVHFFPLAGRLAMREDSLMDLHCNDEGVLFLEASVEADLGVIGGPKPMPALSGLDFARLGPGPYYIPDQIKSIPALVVLVTRFKCGSIAIAANWHHTVADGSSGFHFMKSWAEVSSGSPISLMPNHDRQVFRPRDPPNASLVNGYSTQSVESELVESDHDVNPQLEPSTTPLKRLSSGPAMLNSFIITKESMLKLKDEVRSESEDGSYFTSAETISGYLWRQMVKSRANDYAVEERRNVPKDTTTRFVMFVDGRKRMNLPAGYFGNVVCRACAIAHEEDILTKPVSYATSLIRKAIRNISGEYFQSLIDWVEIKGSLTSKSEPINSLGDYDVAATFWTFFPLYEMDFGWGKPEFAARNSPPRPLIDGIAVMPSSQGKGDMMALVNLHADRMDRLRKQNCFTERFKLSS